MWSSSQANQASARANHRRRSRADRARTAHRSTVFLLGLSHRQCPASDDRTTQTLRCVRARRHTRDEAREACRGTRAGTAFGRRYEPSCRAAVDPDERSLLTPSTHAAAQEGEDIRGALTGVRKLARRRPVLMVYEDVHWIDPTSRELLDLTIERARRLPMLLLCVVPPQVPTALDRPATRGDAHTQPLGSPRRSGTGQADYEAKDTPE